MIKELSVDLEKCIHCEECADSCFVDVLYWDDEKEIPYAKYPEECQVCCICEAICPQNAITVIPDWDKKYYPKYISTQEARNE